MEPTTEIFLVVGSFLYLFVILTGPKSQNYGAAADATRDNKAKL